ncbi:FAD-dependent oxidoreductase, partial [Desulfobacula sp.]|nr:CoB--CoM heterodisulfide reductase iron-sulfur subunit A family protein [Desulfobacula sp.]
MVSTHIKNFDTLVVGGGIAGLQTALDLGDQGYRVAVVEKDASIGGKMIRLSKVFPTLDCASCITTPKMSAVAHHENITLFTYCELNSLDHDGSGESQGIKALITQNPRYVDPIKCIGCRQCEYVCPVHIPDMEQGGLSATKAISIPFSNAIPQLPIMDIENCMLCGQCEKACPTNAIDYFQKPEEFTITAKTAVITTGFDLLAVKDNVQYGNGRIPNVIDSLQMERLLAPHGPYNRVLRPSDGMEPDSIAYVQCAGSRDKSMGVSYCSRVCCMYAIKQAMLLSGSLPLADIIIYYMDIRAFGKGYEQFYQNAKAMGIEFVKAKVARIDKGENGSAQVRYELQDGSGIATADHDLVVLSMGMVPGWNPEPICPVSK